MTDRDKDFVGSIPEIYDTYLVPLIYETYAQDLADGVGALGPQSVKDSVPSCSELKAIKSTRYKLERHYN